MREMIREPMKNHLLIDVDSKIPNLALMKIAGWAREKGDKVDFNIPTRIPDDVWVSCLFTWNKQKAIDSMNAIKSYWPNVEVHLGGTGIDLGKDSAIRSYLPPQVESMLPDYSLYPKDDRAVGFVQRGCNRKCTFCDVPKKEGLIRDNVYNELGNWVPKDRKKVLLLDNNMAQNPNHDAILKEAESMGIKLSITQGYDVRCLTKEKAEMLGSYKPWALRFTERRIYIAWDFFGIEPFVIRGIEMLKDAGFRGREIMCYCLAGYNTTEEQDLHKILTLKDLGVLPYLMPFNNGHEGCKDAKRVKAMTRWVNYKGGLYNFIPWDKYDHVKQGKLPKPSKKSNYVNPRSNIYRKTTID